MSRLAPMTAFVEVRLESAPERRVMVAVGRILSIGEDPAGGSRIILDQGGTYDVVEDLEVLMAKLGEGQP